MCSAVGTLSSIRCAWSLSFHAVGHAVFLDVKADFPVRFLRRRHELADGVEQGADAGIVPFNLSLQFGQFVGEFLVQGQRLAQAHKHAHDGDVDLNRARTAQHARKHRDAFLRENMGQILDVLAFLQGAKMEP